MSFKQMLLTLTILMICGVSSHALGSDSGGADAYEIKIITYNVAGLPDFITYDRGMAPTKERFSYIGDTLKKYDIIAIQEAFIPEREIIEKKLRAYYVVHGADVGMVKLMGSGVYTYSKWPVTQSHYEKWEHLTGADALSLKGFVAATVNVSPGFSIDVYNVHGQTGRSSDKVEMKLKNFARMSQYMEYQSGASGRPVLLIGDFNIREGDAVWQSIVDGMGVTMIPDPAADRPDHLFYKENGSGWRISVVDSGTDFTEPFKDDRPSDHIAFRATLRFEKIK